ncbi:hypothetical protein K466DRAFT_571031 [Polyporus arcularius HHB13444]|uniref:F-box domain-containing protein n=1 Tax=Polyporus arcularius HHB13444 TaxID=1314778 RepID=A0A5C3NLN0_9APHY|nr:hypothetical protein K466DRAFT_571031 [Polyporus arcularius HHB13444]
MITSLTMHTRLAGHTDQPGAVRLVPPEIWSSVAASATRDTLSNLRAVSRPFRKLVDPVLFARISVTLGCWRMDDDAVERDELEDEIPNMENEQPDGESAQALARNNRIACELLHHISNEPAFAHLVRSMTIHACSPTALSTLEWSTLQKAIPRLTKLVRFQWLGVRPRPSTGVLQALVQVPTPSLQHLSLPDSNGARSCLAKFTSLQTLALHTPEREQPSTFSLAQVVADPLSGLALWGHDVRLTTVHTVRHLQELELLEPRSLEGFEAILAQCDALLSLTLDQPDEAFFGALRARPHSVPQLTALKLLSMRSLEDSHATALVDFLEGKPLRMVDLWLHMGFWGTMRLEEDKVLRAVKKLPKLEVLGLPVPQLSFCLRWDDTNFGSDVLGPRAAEIYVEGYIPTHISALTLRWVVTNAELARNMLLPVISALPSLQYLHIMDHTWTVEWFRERLLEVCPVSLRLFGYGQHMHCIERVPDTSTPTGLTLWPSSRVHFCTPEDFGCADWEWLFRHTPLFPWVRPSASSCAPAPIDETFEQPSKQRARATRGLRDRSYITWVYPVG